MSYQIDWSRLLGVLLLLGGGLFFATRLTEVARLGGPPVVSPTRQVALRGMWLMTLLGLSSGVVGAWLEGALGEGLLVLTLHGIYSVCWAPVFCMTWLGGWFSAGDDTSRFFSEILGLLGLMLLPVCWFTVFLGAAHLRRRLRRR
ncbi:MAG TPA: hypothetical protein VJU61_12545 [Polyangiaceae bacterium]|nr:hypothetical protein [Polyangiaceae bacterium]